MELAGAGGFGTGIVLHKCRRGFELPRIWDLTGTSDDPWIKTKLADVGQNPITWTLSDSHGSFERVEGVLQDWQPQFEGRINVRIQWTGAVYSYGILRED
jgi:hypothetical protein